MWNWSASACDSVWGHGPDRIIEFVIGETFEGENLHYFTVTCESFIHEILGMPHPFNIPQNAPFLPIREGFLPIAPV